jgi:hypothetical protein
MIEMTDNEQRVTERQKEFIESLIENFDVDTVSKEDASDVINCLSKFQNSYAPCGRHRSVDTGRAFVMGDLDWCIHNCETDVYMCEYWN